ncbi:Tn3 family transposase [Parafrankia sp. EUN1f]|uniref:Tn3 family transposase n=1 Tax=Parafrankia sp. EUN1f TaxID=102897 RepID=UPI00055F6E70|nr:Tn3 family transposase [Parafrankia sp. EUN1f]
MPLEFLTDAQVARYGRFQGVPSRAELERFFFLDDVDRGLIADRRGDHNRLGFVVQATTVRFLGLFLEDPLDVPWPVVEYLGQQLGIGDVSCVKRYTERSKTAYEHAWEIRDAYGFRPFEDERAAAEFRRFLDGRAWTHAEGPGALFDEGVGWLRRARVLLPGVTVLTRLVNTVREAAAGRMHATLAEAAAAADPMLPGVLVGALAVPPGGRVSRLEEWRRAPTRVSGSALVKALDRAADLAGLGVRRVDCSVVPANRLASLARYGLASKAPSLAELAEPRRTATLLAVARHLDAVAVDDALDLFALLMATKLINPSRQASNAERLGWLPRLERASRVLALAGRALVDVLDAAAAHGRGVDVAAAWAAVEAVAPRERVAGAIAVVEELVPDDDGSAEVAMRVALAERYRTVRSFLPLLGESSLAAAAAGQPVLEAVRALPGLAARRVKAKPLTPEEIDGDLVPSMWRRAVYANPDLPDGAVDRDAYVICVLEQLHRALRVRDVYAVPSHRWGDPRARLLAGSAWTAVRGDILDGLGLSGPAETHLRGQVDALDAAWRQMAARLAEAGETASVRVVPDGDSRMRLAVERLEALEIPPSLEVLRARTAAMLPRVDLPELLLEVHSWTGFLDAYVHVSGAVARIRDLPLSVAALLVAEACNVGLTPVTNPNDEALTRGRLSHVDQNYLRAETHTAANAALIDAQSRIPIAAVWGGGLLASVDGLRFVVPVRTLNAGPSPKYFGYKRGLTWLNAVNDQVAGIGAKVVPGTPRDSLHILDVLLNLDAGPKPEVVATDEASYSDLVFGVFRLLGYRFSPRIADIGDTRYWRATWPGDPAGDYGPLNAIARNKVNLRRILDHWPDLLRVAGSLVTGQVRAYDVLRMLGRDGHPTPLGQAFAEYGRIAKTLHLLAMVDPLDDTHRRAVNTQTTVQESRHKLARTIFHGRRGQIYQAYREGQEDQLGALGLVLNAVVLWNTRYLDAAVTALRAAGHVVSEDDVARLSPLGHAHLNCLGRYAFTVPTGPGLRPLRDPAWSDE